MVVVVCFCFPFINIKNLREKKKEANNHTNDRRTDTVSYAHSARAYAIFMIPFLQRWYEMCILNGKSHRKAVTVTIAVTIFDYNLYFILVFLCFAGRSVRFCSFYINFVFPLLPWSVTHGQNHKCLTFNQYYLLHTMKPWKYIYCARMRGFLWTVAIISFRIATKSQFFQCLCTFNRHTMRYKKRLVALHSKKKKNTEIHAHDFLKSFRRSMFLWVTTFGAEINIKKKMGRKVHRNQQKHTKKNALLKINSFRILLWNFLYFVAWYPRIHSM